MARAMALCEIPIGLRYSSKSISPVESGVFIVSVLYPNSR